ncbi:GNAT family N-acetyltransferase [Streptomyces sp. NPDC050704]|uniref:GNAT family N-acetyltransferase n=1 Tax=Streptomyces sp. NPDC050704 TaxID=3157219 RepID=UPI00341A6D3E
MSEISIRDDRERGRLEAFADSGSDDPGGSGGSGGSGGEVVGRIEYFVLESPGRAFVPVHTIVEPAHEGKGIAGSLARELYAIAAREDVPVAPLCPYVVKWAERHPDEAPAADPERLSAAKEWLRTNPGRF